MDGPGKWKAIYTIVHAPEKDGDHVHLELFNPKRGEEARAAFPLAGESCSTMAQVVALVLERYFSDVSREGDCTTTALAGASRGPGRAVPDVAPRPGTDAGDAYRAAVVLAGGWLTPPSSPALSFDARMWLHPRVHLGLGVAWSPGSEEQQVGPPGGAARLSVVPVRASLGFGYDASFAYFYLGPDVLVSFDQATTSGIAAPGGTTGRFRPRRRRRGLFRLKKPFA